jgi:hypothetical protein
MSYGTGVRLPWGGEVGWITSFIIASRRGWMDNHRAVKRIEGDDKDDDCNDDVNKTTLDRKQDPEVLRLVRMSLKALCRQGGDPSSPTCPFSWTIHDS